MYRLLAASIITQAFDDIKRFNPRKCGQNARVTLSDYKGAVKFFKSEWFRALALETGADSGAILDRVREEQRKKDAQIEEIEREIAEKEREKESLHSTAQNCTV